MIVRIKASRPVFRRLGVVFSKQWQDFAADRFTEAELATLKADPVLTVTEVDGELQADPAPAGTGGQAPSGGSASVESPPTPAPKPDKTARVPAKAGGKAAAKSSTSKAKAPAKPAGKPAAQADKDEQPTGDGANSSAKPEEGGTGEGRE